MSEQTDYQRGLKEGARDALLEEHTARLNSINGSIERHAKSNEDLTKAVNNGLSKLTQEIQVMQVEARVREERVKAVADTLAAENERRRVALADEGGRWTLRANKSTVASAAAAFFFALATIYLSFH